MLVALPLEDIVVCSSYGVGGTLISLSTVPSKPPSGDEDSAENRCGFLLLEEPAASL